MILLCLLIFAFQNTVGNVVSGSQRKGKEIVTRTSGRDLRHRKNVNKPVTAHGFLHFLTLLLLVFGNRAMRF